MSPKIKLFKGVMFEKAYFMVVFGLMALVLGLSIPRLYYEFTPKKYVTVEQITFDKQVYKPCENVKIISTYLSDITTEIELQTQVIKLGTDGSKEVYNNQAIPSKTFLIATSKPQVLIRSTQVSCDMPEGTYLLEGVFTYKIRGATKTVSFVSDPVTIIKE